MDEKEVKKLEGRKIIGLNSETWIDENNNVCKGYVVEIVEALGKDWVVTRGNNLNLTRLKNPVQDIGEVLTEEGEPGQPINDSQWLQLQEVLKR
jgi:hypothetical protein